jgi:DNA-binding winged helix-turn-helix (wHTH) protein
LQAFAKGAVVRIRFGPFDLDLDTRQLTRDNHPLELAPKAFDLLVALVLERPKVLSKAALLQRLWPDTFVEEANLSNLVAEIRHALGDQARAPRFVRTAHGFGYAFCAEAVNLPGATIDRAAAFSCWLEWGRRRFPLSIGHHVIGRDPDLDVTIDASTVSRRHARLIVTVDGTMLEDIGSKNGTLRGGERVTSPVKLTDGDTIHLGSLRLTFHSRPGMMSTDTLAGAPQ